MVMPLWDHSPFKWPTPPYVMWLLIVVNFVVFFVQASGGSPQMNQTDHVAGVIPVAFTGHSVGGLWPPLTLITHQFLHINFGHVFGNMIFLFVFGDDIEEVLGHWRFLAFYLLCGIGAGLVFVLSSLDSNRPLIGASGAVAGVLSAYLLFRPCARVTCLLGLIPLRLRAYWIICGWAIWQVVEAANRVQDGVAYWGHVGGLITGAVLFIVIRPAGIKLFDCVHSEPALVTGKSEPPMTTNPDQRPHAWLAGSAMRAASDAGLGLVLLCAGAAAILAAGGMILRRGFALGPGFFPTGIGWLLVPVGIALLLRAILLRNRDDARWSLTSVAIITITAAVLFTEFATRQWGVNFPIYFGPSEFVAIILFGLAVAIALARASRLRAAGMLLLGTLIATIGSDPEMGSERLTMGLNSLANGISLVTVMLGFAAADGALCAVSPSLLEASYARKVGRRLAWKPLLPVSLLLRVAGVLLVAAAFYADYVFEGAGWPVGPIAAFAAFGIACQLLGWNRLVLLMAMVLGPLLELNTRRALLISRGDPATFLRWPISGTVLLLAAAILTLAIVLSAWRALPRRRPA